MNRKSYLNLIIAIILIIINIIIFKNLDIWHNNMYLEAFIDLVASISQLILFYILFELLKRKKFRNIFGIIIIVLSILAEWFKGEIMNNTTFVTMNIFFVFLQFILIFICLILVLYNLFKKNHLEISYTVFIIIMVIILYVPFYDIRIQLNFNHYYTERMKLIDYYKEMNSDKRIEINLPTELSHLSINKKMIIEENKYFYTLTDLYEGNNQYLLYTEYSTDKIYQDGEVNTLKNLGNNWYYLKYYRKKDKSF